MKSPARVFAYAPNAIKKTSREKNIISFFEGVLPVMAVGFVVRVVRCLSVFKTSPFKAQNTAGQVIVFKLDYTEKYGTFNR